MLVSGCATFGEKVVSGIRSGHELEAEPEFIAAPIEEGWPRNAVPQFRNSWLGASWSPEPGVLWVFVTNYNGCPTLVAAAEATMEPSTGIFTELFARFRSVGTSQPNPAINIALSRREEPGRACTDALTKFTAQVRVPPGIAEDQPLTLIFKPDDTLRNREFLATQIVVPPRPYQSGIYYAAWREPGADETPFSIDNMLGLLGSWAPGIPQSIMPTFVTSSQSVPTCPIIAGPAHFKVIEQGDGEITYDTKTIIIDVPDPREHPPPGGYSCAITGNYPTTTIVAVPVIPRAPATFQEYVDNGEPITVQLGELGTTIAQPRSAEFQPGTVAFVP